MNSRPETGAIRQSLLDNNLLNDGEQKRELELLRTPTASTDSNQGSTVGVIHVLNTHPSSNGQSTNTWTNWFKHALLHTKYTIQHIPNAQHIIGWTLFAGLAVDAMMMAFFEDRLHQLLDDESCHLYGMPKDTPCTELYSSEHEAETYINQRALYFAIDYLFRHLLRSDRAPFILGSMFQYLPPLAYLTYHNLQVKRERQNAIAPQNRYENRLAAWFSCNNNNTESQDLENQTPEQRAAIYEKNRRKPSDTALYSIPFMFICVALWEILGSVIAAKSTEAYLNEYDKNNKIYEDLTNVADEEKKFNTIRDTLARAPKEASDYLHSHDFTAQLSIAVGVTVLFFGFLYSLKELQDNPALTAHYNDINNSYIELKEGIDLYNPNNDANSNSNPLRAVTITNNTTSATKNISDLANDLSPLDIMLKIIDDETIKGTNNWVVEFRDNQNTQPVFSYNNLTRSIHVHQNLRYSINTEEADIENPGSVTSPLFYTRATLDESDIPTLSRNLHEFFEGKREETTSVRTPLAMFAQNEQRVDEATVYKALYNAIITQFPRGQIAYFTAINGQANTKGQKEKRMNIADEQNSADNAAERFARFVIEQKGKDAIRIDAHSRDPRKSVRSKNLPLGPAEYSAILTETLQNITWVKKEHSTLPGPERITIDTTAATLRL